MPLSITIKTLQQKQFKIEVDETDSIGTLKSKIEAQHGHPASSQKLIYSGKILSDDKTIGELDIKEKDFLVLMVAKAKAPSASSSTANPSSATTATSSTSGGTSATPTLATQPAPAPAPSPTVVAAPAPTTEDPTTASTAPLSSGLGMSSFVTGQELQTSIQNMVEMGFSREEVMRAMRASYNNPDRAVEYLMTGIPAHLDAQLQQEPRAAPTGTTPTTAATAPPPATPVPAPAIPAVSEPQNLFQAAAAAASGGPGGAPATRPGARAVSGGSGGAAPPVDIQALRDSPMGQQMQQLMQQNPALLQPLIQSLVAGNPGLAEALQANPELLYSLLRGEGGPGGEAGDEFDAPPPPGTQFLEVTREERAAIDRLTALGFPEEAAIQAYFACDKNEELAANFLFENGGFD